MRQRVEGFLKTRLRSMLIPATLGLGLALSACDSDALNADDGGDPSAQKDSGTVTKYMAQIPDAAAELSADTRDSGLAVRYSAQMLDARGDLPGAVAVYTAQMPRS
jgi:hypothetical protein